MSQHLLKIMISDTAARHREIREICVAIISSRIVFNQGSTTASFTLTVGRISGLKLLA